MKITNFSLASVLALLIMVVGTASFAKSLHPTRDHRGNVVTDSRGNCVRTEWVAHQCCDPCGYEDASISATPIEPPFEPIPKYLTREKAVTYVDLVRQSIYFKIDKDNIDTDDRERMNAVIKEIQNSDGVRAVRLVGYADRYASDDYNVDLSRRRAQNSLNYFDKKGFFKDDNVKFGFFGESRPVTNCSKSLPRKEQVACLQADRRVDIEVELYRNKIDVVKELVYLDENGQVISREQVSTTDSFQYTPPEGVVFEEMQAN